MNVTPDNHGIPCLTEQCRSIRIHKEGTLLQPEEEHGIWTPSLQLPMNSDPVDTAIYQLLNIGSVPDFILNEAYISYI